MKKSFKIKRSSQSAILDSRFPILSAPKHNLKIVVENVQPINILEKLIKAVSGV